MPKEVTLPYIYKKLKKVRSKVKILQKRNSELDILKCKFRLLEKRVNKFIDPDYEPVLPVDLSQVKTEKVDPEAVKIKIENPKKSAFEEYLAYINAQAKPVVKLQRLTDCQIQHYLENPQSNSLAEKDCKICAKPKSNKSKPKPKPLKKSTKAKKVKSKVLKLDPIKPKEFKNNHKKLKNLLDRIKAKNPKRCENKNEPKFPVKKLVSTRAQNANDLKKKIQDFYDQQRSTNEKIADLLSDNEREDERRFKEKIANYNQDINWSKDARKVEINGKYFFQCLKCSINISTNFNLYFHTLLHTGEHPLKCLLPLCDMKFRTIENRRTHELVKHDEEIKELRKNSENFQNPTCTSIQSDTESDQSYLVPTTPDSPSMISNSTIQKPTNFEEKRKIIESFYIDDPLKLQEYFQNHVSLNTQSKSVSTSDSWSSFFSNSSKSTNETSPRASTSTASSSISNIDKIKILEEKKKVVDEFLQIKKEHSYPLINDIRCSNISKNVQTRNTENQYTSITCNNLVQSQNQSKPKLPNQEQVQESPENDNLEFRIEVIDLD